MTHQPTFWDAPDAPPRRPRHRTASTSSDALDRVRPVRGRQQQAVLDALRAHGAMTRHELAAVTGLALQSVCGRANELLRSGEVRELVERGRRVVRDGRHVLVATFTARTA
jgi:hypothetical protein